MTDLSRLWDMDAVVSEDLDVTQLAEKAVGWGGNRIRTRDLTYTSHSWAEGEVVIRAHLALPPGDGPVPCMILGTGDADSGDAYCRRHGVATITIDRPGTGESTGPEDLYTNWVNFTDPRDSWMWHYVMSGLRAVTLAGAIAEIDPERVGITGYSRGGTMAWIANGVDPRLKLAIPVATGGDIVRALDHGGWANYIYLDDSGQPAIPPEFHEFAKHYDPMLYCGRQQGAVLLIVGAQDEYFPLYCTKTSAEAAAADEFRLLVIADWDHGYFAGDNPEVDAYDNRTGAREKENRAAGAAIDCRLKSGPPMPRMPALTATRSGDELALHVDAEVADGAESVVYVSLDGAYTFTALPSSREGAGFTAELSGADSSLIEGFAAYAECRYPDGPVLTSAPVFGPAFEQRMRPFPKPEED